MGLTKQGKLEACAAERGPLEHEEYRLEIELETKKIAVKHKVTGVTKDMVDEVKARLDIVKEQMAAVDARVKEAKAEKDDED